MASSSTPANSGKTPKPALRILCFGNSLTAGYPADNPYGIRLKEKLEEVFPHFVKGKEKGGKNGGGVEFDVDGVPGDLVARGSFLGRMESAWQQAEHPYDWTIVLGGTNDIGWGVDTDQLIEGLKRSWDIPLSKGGKVLALTIPETKYRSAKLEESRNKVNDAIRGYKKKNFFHFDLFNAIPYHSMPAGDRPTYWEMDGVHLTAAGYDLMGEKIAEALVRILRLAEAQDTEISEIVTDPRQRRAIEDLIVEEERGDHKLLSQGYIIVRKRDLD
ncbi:Uu.00g009490.m01.CDS01 [Anthostomella pinea]|uniref:Uu.00g009490.m01.CDS01 n=1 Tax=Anthostomella pinea TaxID=933095 RepID=A0AAI8YQ04_9PEZI|nr:Uu.00g009490.m01.CDS01 [Anthostomella pinea]